MGPIKTPHIIQKALYSATPALKFRSDQQQSTAGSEETAECLKSSNGSN